ncbi:hypothetical protein GCM10027293_27490 [Pontibacter aydingkolensis]
MCTGSQGTLWVLEPDPNLIYKWYNVATGGTPLVWGTSYTSGTSGDYYVEAVTQQGCTSSTRTKASLTASSPTGSGGGISTSTQEVCSGTSPGQISGNAPNSSFMTYQWFQSTTGSSSDFYPIPTAKNKDYTPPALYQTTWFKRISYNGFCGEESNVLRITVTPLPAAPIVNNAVVCAGTNATLTVSNASTSSIYRWYDVASGGTAIAVGPTFTTPVLTATRTYYVDASTTNNTNCSSVTQRTAVSVTVTPGITNNIITSDQSICSGGTAAALLGSDPAGGGGGYSFQWQRSTDGSSFTDIAGANAKDYNPGSPTTTTWYRRKVKAASTCPEVTSNTVRIVVSILPVSIDIVDPTTCAGSGTTIVISNPNADYTYRWYDIATGGTPLRTGTTFPTGPLTSNRTYYVEVTTAAGCISARRSVTVTVTPVPAAPTASGTTICAGTSTTLSVNPTNATLYYKWYDAPTGGTHLGTGESFATGPLTSDKTFYVEAVTNAAPNCTSPREAVQVTVVPVITNTITSTNQEICSGNTPSPLTGTIPTGGGGGYTYQWQTSDDGTLFTNITGATGRDYAPGALTNTTWYRRQVSTTAGTCPPVSSNVVRVDVNQLPTVPLIPGVAICTGTQATIQIPSADANLKYNWYTVATGGVPVATDLSSFITEALTSNKTYYVEAVTEFGCVSTTRRAVTVTVEPLPGVPTADNTSVCAGNKAVLYVVSPDPSLEYQWFNAATAGNLLATGTSFTTPNALNSTTTYYLQAVNATGCASSSRRAVAVTVLELPLIPEVAGATICSGGATTLYVNNSNPEYEYRWYSGSTLIATGTSFNTGNLISSATYYVDAVTKGTTACTSPGRRAVTVTVIPPISNNTISAAQSVCGGTTPAALTGTTPTGGSTPLTFQWEKSENGINFTSIAGATNATYSTGALSTTTWFRRIVKGSDTCPQNASNAVQITVTPLPATPVADAQTICNGSSAMLSVNAPVSGITYKWYNAATGGNILSTEVTYTTDALNTNTTFYVEATNANGCVSPRRPVTVSVRELPEMPMAANKTICYGQSATLSVTAPDPSLTYKWYNSDNQLLSSLPSLNVAGLQASAVYYLEATYISEPDCSSPRREVTVTVTQLPGLPVVANITICSGTKGILNVQNPDPALTYRWYNTDSDGTSIGTGASFETQSLTSARTYYVEASTASGCQSGRRQVTVSVSALPETPFANNAEVCAGAMALLSVSDANDALTYQWYATSTSSTPIATGKTFQTGVLQANATFYVEAVTAAGCVSPARRAVTVSVTPLPATPNANNASICAGSEVTLAVENPNPSLLYKWYSSEGAHLATGILYNTGVLNDSRTYYLEAVTANSTSCASSSRKTVTVTVTPVIANNTISGNQIICAGSTPATLTGTLPTGGGTTYSYQWQQSTDGINFTNITGATSQDYTPGTVNATTWYRRRVTASGPCGPNFSAAVQVSSVTPPSTSLADNSTICSGTRALLTIKDANTTLSYRWYGTATGGSILNIDDTFETPELSTTTTFYVEAVNTNGCASPRRAVTVYVTPVPQTPLVSDKYICEGQAATLTVSSSVQNLIYKWYDNTGTLVGTGTSYTTPNALIASTTYYVEASTTTNPTCTSDRRAVAVVVMSQPAIPVVENATVCSGTSATLSVRVIDPAITYKWYTAQTGGTPVAESINFTTTALTSSRTYYVEAVNAAGCTSTRASVAVTVTPLPAAPLAENAAVCAGTAASLTVTNPDNNLIYKWYDAATDGNLLATGTNFTTPVLQNSATYYLSAESLNGCASTTRSAVTVNVTPLPATPEVNNVTICEGSNVTLWVTNQTSGVVYKWYDNTGAYLATGTSYTTASLITSTTYTVEAVTNTSTACASSPRKTVNVTVVAPIANNTVSSAQTVCTGGTPSPLTGSVPSGGNGSYTYQWERSTDGINFAAISGAISQNYAPATAITSDTWFRRKVSATGGPCAAHVSNIIKMSVESLPATPIVNGATICAGTVATLQVSNPDNALTYRWYTTATGGNPIHAQTTFITNELNTSVTYYVEAMSASGCVSPRRTVTVTVRPLPDVPVVADKAICQGQTTTLAVASPLAGQNYKWYDRDNTLVATGISFTTPALATTTVYYVESSYVDVPECISNSRATVTVSVAPLPSAPIAAGSSICSGNTAALKVSVIDANLTYKWYTIASGGTPVATSANFTTPVLTTGRTYYVEAVTESGCASPRTAVRVDVTLQPATPSADNQQVCEGSTVVLTVNNPNNNLYYNWYNEATDGQLLATGETYTISSVTASVTYYVEAVTETGCVSPTRKAVEITVTPLPLTPQVNNLTVCAGQSAILSVTPAEAGVLYRWYNATGTLIYTGTTFTSSALQESTVLYVEGVTNNTTACASSPRRTVYVTVTPAIANNIINGEQSICSGSAPVTLNGSTPTGGEGSYTYQWERSEDGINFTSIANATGQNHTPSALNITTWYRRKVKAAGACSEQVSNIVQITVTAIPATPVADNATICEGATATLRIKDVNTAYTYRWYTTPVGGNAIMAAASYTTDVLESTTTFYVEAVNANGCVSPRRTVTVYVLPLPDAPLAADQNICTGEQATLVVSNQAANLTYSWYDGNGMLLATGTTFTTGALNNNAIYYVEASTTTVPSCVSGRTAVTVYVAARPATPMANNVSVCAGSSAELAVSNVIPGLTYKWYTVATGGQPIHISSNFTTQPLTSNRTYYLEAVTANGCVSSERRAVTVTVTPQPAQPAVADRTVCYGERAVLAVTTPNANLMYRWYNRDGVQVATGTTYTTGAITANALYYVEAVTQTSPSCISSREAVNVTVTNIPATPVVDNATICTGSSTTLFVKNAMPGAVYKWYDENETVVATGTTFTTAVLSIDAIYSVEASSTSGCVNQVRAMVTVDVTQQITNNTITDNQTICSGATPNRLTGSQPGNTSSTVLFQWEYSEDGTNFTSITNATGRDYQPEALNVTTWFRRKAKVENGVCAEQYSNVIRVTTVALPLAPVTSSVTICAGAQATLRVDAAEATYTYRWFDVATGGSSLANGTSFTVGGLTSDKIYYVEAINANGCISPRKAVTVYTTPLPAMPQAADKSVCTGGSTTLSVSNPDTKLNYRWFDANGALVANGSSYTTPNLGSNTVYFVEAFTNTALACTSPRRAVNVAVTPLPTMPEVDDAFVCAGGSATLSVKQPDPALTYRWYSAATGGTPLAAQPTFETGALTSDRTYFVEAVNASGCVSPREAVNVTVTPLPAEPLASNKAICAGQTVVLSVNQPDVTLTYRWFDSTGKLLATGNTFSVSGLTASATYYVESMTAAGCVSPTRKGVVVSVSQLPGVPTVENAAICAGERVTLFVKNPDPTLEYRWYNDAAGTNLIGSGISYTSTDALFAGKSYFVEAVNTAGCVSVTRKQVDVRVTGKPATPVANDATVCSGSSATLSIIAPDGAMVYKWYDVNGTFLHTGITYTTVPLSSKATFHVVANTTTTPACASDVHVVTVNITTPLTNNTISSSQTICSGATPARLSGSMPNGGSTATITYQWESSTDGVNFVSIVGAYAQDYAPGALTADTWFRRVARAAGACSQTVSNAVMVTVIPLPVTPVADNQRVCTGNSATLKILNPSSTADNITYRWYNVASGGNALASGIMFVTPALSVSTTYYVEATNGNGCTSSTRRAVQVLVDQPITNNTISGAKTVCAGGKASALFGSIPDGGSGTYTYQWQRSTDGANFTDISGATGQGYTPTENFTKTTWFRRKVKTEGSCAESISAAVKIEVVFSPNAPTVTSAAICPGVSTTLTATAMAGLTVEWYDAPQGGTLVFIGSSYTTPVLNSNTSYWVQSVSTSGCESTRQEAKVQVVGPQVTVSEDLTIIEGKTVQLSATGGASYEWSPAEGLSDPTISTPVAKPAKTTTYVVKVTTREGCVVTKQVTVTVLPRIIITNVITPNGDGYNDRFEIKGIENYPNATVEIYTRWGEQVFQSKGYPEAWNGTKNGNALPVGAYYYIIKLDATSAPISGSVTIVK